VDDTSVRRLGWVGHITRTQDERIPKRRFLMEKSKIQDGRGCQEQGGRVLPMGMQLSSRNKRLKEMNWE
jgi:hypothetical protein